MDGKSFFTNLTSEWLEICFPQTSHSEGINFLGQTAHLKGHNDWTWESVHLLSRTFSLMHTAHSEGIKFYRDWVYIWNLLQCELRRNIWLSNWKLNIKRIKEGRLGPHTLFKCDVCGQTFDVIDMTSTIHECDVCAEEFCRITSYT